MSTIARRVRFNRLYDEVTGDRVSEPWLVDVEARDNIFPDLDYRIYAT